MNLARPHGEFSGVKRPPLKAYALLLESTGAQQRFCTQRGKAKL